MLGILERFEPPAAVGLRAGRRHATPAGSTSVSRRPSSPWPTATRYLTDPEARDVPVDDAARPGPAGRPGRGHRPGRAARPAPSTNPVGGGTIYLATVDGDGNAVSLIESNYMGFGSGVVDPATGIHYQNRGSYFSLDPDHAERPRAAQADAPHAAPRDAVPARRAGPWIVAGSMGGDAQPQVHAQFVSAVVDGGVDIRTAVAAPRWYIEPADHYAPPTAVHLEPRHAPGIDDTLRALGHDLVPTAAFDSNLGHEHAIELVDGGPSGPMAPSPPPRIRAARDFRRSGKGLEALAAICDTRGPPVAGERSHDAATGEPSAPRHERAHRRSP